MNEIANRARVEGESLNLSAADMREAQRWACHAGLRLKLWVTPSNEVYMTTLASDGCKTTDWMWSRTGDAR